MYLSKGGFDIHSLGYHCKSKAAKEDANQPVVAMLLNEYNNNIKVRFFPFSYYANEGFGI